jgi:putative DNA primase/helicase
MLYLPLIRVLIMSTIAENHLQEFKASAIADDIAALNFQSFDGDDENDLDEVFTLLIEEPDHNNNGTLAGKSQNDLANALRGGCWRFGGCMGICIKPNNPRKDKEGKVIKYESPRGSGSIQLFIPRVSWGIGRKISAKASAVVEAKYLERMDATANPSDEDSGFWEWFLTTDIPILITEGAKKACSLVSAGYPAIALNGIWGWGTNDRDMFGNVERDDRGKSIKTIHPDLEPFLDGREIVLALDRDEKPETKKMVEAAKTAFVRAIEGDNITVTQLIWRSPKGIDDYIAAKGVKNLDRIYTNRKEIKPKQPKEKVKQTQFFTSIEHGLQRVTCSESEGGKETNSTEQIGNHLEAIAYLDNPEGTGASILLELETVRNQVKKIPILRSDLAGDGVPILSHLMSCGYHYNRKNKTELLEYLHSLGAGIDRTYTIVDATGWVNGRYVSQHKTYGDGDYVFQQVESSSETATEIKGTLAEWKTHVGSKCDNNSRLIFMLGIAIAAPLLPVVGLESGGFHLMGDTSTGKTTAVKVAVSVTGEKEIPNWRTTANGLEMTATAHNHSMLPLDEIGQADEKGVGEACYMLRNGQGKSRSTKDLRARKVKKWQLLFLSTGEHSLASYMAQAGKVIKGGQEVGMPDIPAVPFGSPYGVFESIHGCESSKEFAESLEAACQKYRGTAIDAFLTQLVVDRQDKSFDGATAARVFTAAKKLSEGTIDLAVSRVANRFALVQVALEIAHSYDILPFPIDRIEWAVKKMFTDWLNQRGGDGSIEIKNAIERIKHLLISNEFSDRVFTLPDNNDRPVRGLLAYRKLDLEGQTEEFWVPTTTFDKEFCDGANKKQLVKELQRIGWLLPPRPDGKSTHQRTRKGATNYYFVFGKRVLFGEGSEGSEGEGLNADVDKLLEPSPSLHHSKNTSEGGEGSPSKNDASLHRLHQPSLTGEGNVKSQNDYPVTNTDAPSLPSPPSPLKTQVGNLSKSKVKENAKVEEEVIDCEKF